MKYTTLRVIAVFLIALTICFSACVKDDCQQKYTYTYYIPVYITKDEARANVKSNAPRKLEYPGKIYIRDKYIFLNEVDRGIHIIDNSNPLTPRNVAFINIPGNRDIAVNGNILYADLYSDLLAIDISNPLQVKLKNYLENVFPDRGYVSGGPGINGGSIVSDWLKKDTTITGSCERSIMDFPNIYGRAIWFQTASSSSPLTSVSPIGQGGSMARFTLVNDRMYSVGTSTLDVFNVSTPESPVKGAKINLGWSIETIYPFGNKLFIGSQTGMFIYDISNPDAPQATGQFTHARSCDPVIADGDFAYVTLRSGTMCQGFNNQLDVIKLNDLVNPSLVKSYQLTNPHGLSKDGDLLFICDGQSGVKVYNAANKEDLKLVKHIDSFDAYDVIAFNKIALITGKDGLYQYSYASPSGIKMLSKIRVEK
jgi:hypothetical protein